MRGLFPSSACEAPSSCHRKFSRSDRLLHVLGIDGNLWSRILFEDATFDASISMLHNPPVSNKKQHSKAKKTVRTTYNIMTGNMHSSV